MNVKVIDILCVSSTNSLKPRFTCSCFEVVHSRWTWLFFSGSASDWFFDLLTEWPLKQHKNAFVIWQLELKNSPPFTLQDSIGKVWHNCIGLCICKIHRRYALHALEKDKHWLWSFQILKQSYLILRKQMPIKEYNNTKYIKIWNRSHV